MRSSRSLRVAIVGSALALMPATLASAQAGGPDAGASLSVSRAPDRLTWPSSVSGDVAVTITSYDREAAIGIAPSPPDWPDRHVYGAPLRYGGPVLDGPGTLSFFAHSGFGTLPTNCLRGAGQNTAGALVRLPPHSQTTLRYRVHLAAAPWRGTDYTVAFNAAIPYDGSVENPTTLEASAPAFQVDGQSGVHVELSSRPVRRKGHRYVTIRRSGSLVIVGKTQPVVRHRRLRLTYRRLRTSSHRGKTEGKIGTARTDRRGRFTYRWLPRLPGLYGVFVRYTSLDRSLVSDTSCGLEFYVKQH